MLAVGAPSVGVSYFTTTVTRAAGAQLLPGQSGFQDIFVERLEARHVGATVVQSLWRSLAIGATVRLVRGSASTGIVSAGDPEAFDNAGDLFPRKSTTKFDTDIGLMVAGTVGKAGIAVRNVFEPRFTTPDGGAITLERRIRAGVSLVLRQAVTVSADADFTKAAATFGEWRDAAVGTEVRPARRVWVRGGIHWNTAGGGSGPGAAPIGSVGGSFAVIGSLVADAQVSFGSENGDRGWGVGARFMF
jgi:hypothetical protein